MLGFFGLEGLKATFFDGKGFLGFGEAGLYLGKGLFGGYELLLGLLHGFLGGIQGQSPERGSPLFYLRPKEVYLLCEGALHFTQGLDAVR
jgi:hypothetical protein